MLEDIIRVPVELLRAIDQELDKQEVERLEQQIRMLALYRGQLQFEQLRRIAAEEL
jgi:hypothetical protein